MTRHEPITLEYLYSILDYNPESGVFIWKYKDEAVPCYNNSIRAWNVRYAGKIAGSLLKSGYIEISIARNHYLAHRLAWFYVTGKWPKKEIDHRDLNHSNNIFINLREATPSQNMANMGLSPKNTSGYKGVYWNKINKRWQAYISINNKSKYLGQYYTKQEAYFAFCNAAKRIRGEFARVA